MHRKRLDWLLVLLLIGAVVLAWKVYDDTCREPNLLWGWLRYTTAHEIPITWAQRWTGILATYVGIACALALGVIAIASVVRRRRTRPGVGLALLAIAFTLFGVPVWQRWLKEAQRDPSYIERGRVYRSNRRDIRNLTGLFLHARERHAGWDRLDGKDAILALVAHGVIDRRNRFNLRILFPDGEESSMPSAEEYAALTAENLGERDFGHLTGYAGPRRDRPARAEYEQVYPVFADVSLGDYAIVGFSDWMARTFTLEDLGLGPEEPLIVGKRATAPLLEQLSDRSGR